MIETVKDYIDYYIISDTGSTDETIQLIKDEMTKYQIPGEVYHNPWQNFAHNRELTLRQVYLHTDCRYLLTIDADEEFRLGENMDKEAAKNFFQNLSHDVYHVKKKFMGNDYFIPFLRGISQS